MKSNGAAKQKEASSESSTKPEIIALATALEGPIESSAQSRPVDAMAAVRAARRGSRINPNESKQEKLFRLAQSRVTAACNKIRLVGNLSAYKPTDAEVDKIMQALGSTCANVETKLRGTSIKNIEFTLR